MNSMENDVSERPNGVRTWLEVDTNAIKHNFDAFRGFIAPETKLMAVVKSNAYGHELAGFSKEVEKLGADFLAVDSILEASTLRKQGVKLPMFVLGYTLPENLRVAEEENISTTLSSFDGLKQIEEYGGSVSVHIKIDSGMHRQGFLPEEAKRVAEALKKLPQVKVEGVYTHFANAKNPSFSMDTDKQIDRFNQATDVFAHEGFSFLKHACATGGTLLFPQYHFDMVRVGIGLCGLWPSEETRRAREDTLQLEPVLSWRAVVSEIKTVKRGESIGYNYTETFSGDTTVAIIPIGYWHGYPRTLSSVGHVLVNGKRARVLGRVSMDMLAIDVTDVSQVKALDVVTLLGRDGDEVITAEELAVLSETINYEAVTRINSRTKRVFI